MNNLLLPKTRRRRQPLCNSSYENIALKLSYWVKTLWLFTRSDMKTVTSPQVIFGLVVALSGSSLTTNDSPKLMEVLFRLPRLVLWVWLSLLSEVIANQRLPSAIVEDTVNKPWRPIPSQRLRATQARQLLLGILPTVYLFSLLSGGSQAFVALTVFSYMYNDLEGANESPIIRNVLNACGLSAFSVGAAEVAVGHGRFGLQPCAYRWIAILGLVIASTVQMQDLPDIEGDQARRRKTAPLIYGDATTRWSLLATVVPWSFICPYYWQVSAWCYIPSCFLGFSMVIHVFYFRHPKKDEVAWKLWCVWMMVLYLLPICK